MKYEVSISVRVHVDAEDEEEAAEKAVNSIKSPLVDRDNVDCVELEDQ
jgi:hypothetical protein